MIGVYRERRWLKIGTLAWYEGTLMQRPSRASSNASPPTESNAMPRRYPVAVLAATLLALGPACESDPPPETKKAAEEDSAPAIKVQLPPSPDFDEGKSPEQWDDGSWSIYGLRAKLDQNVKEGEAGKELLVKAYVQDIYIAPECPEGEVCPPPKQPHVWVTDKPEEKGKKRAMMVVNYRFQIPEWDAARWKDQPTVVLEKGKQYTFKGKFKQFSDTGFAFDRGLLEFVAYKPHDPETGAELNTWVYPPYAPWHPIEVQRVEEENAKLAEKAKASAKPQ